MHTLPVPPVAPQQLFTVSIFLKPYRSVCLQNKIKNKKIKKTKIFHERKMLQLTKTLRSPEMRTEKRSKRNLERSRRRAKEAAEPRRAPAPRSTSDFTASVIIPTNFLFPSLPASQAKLADASFPTPANATRPIFSPEPPQRWKSLKILK